MSDHKPSADDESIPWSVKSHTGETPENDLEDDLRELIDKFEDEAATLRERAPHEMCVENVMANVVELKIEDLEELLE